MPTIYATPIYQAFCTTQSISSTTHLTCTKLAQTCAKEASCHLHICTHRGRLGTGMCRQGPYEEKNNCIETSLQMRRRKRAYLYMNCTGRESLHGYQLFGSVHPPFLTLNAKPVFLSLKSQDILNWTKKHRRLYAKSWQFDWYHPRPTFFVAFLYLWKEGLCILINCFFLKVNLWCRQSDTAAIVDHRCQWHQRRNYNECFWLAADLPPQRSI